MLADPQSVTISGTAYSAPRVGNTDTGATYRSSDGNLVIETTQSRSRAGRNRRVIAAKFTKIAADPLLSGVNSSYSMTMALSINVPDVGFTATEASAVATGVLNYLRANTDAVVGQIISGQI